MRELLGRELDAKRKCDLGDFAKFALHEMASVATGVTAKISKSQHLREPLREHSGGHYTATALGRRAVGLI
jgi:hypothetical protein